MIIDRGKTHRSASYQYSSHLLSRHIGASLRYAGGYRRTIRHLEGNVLQLQECGTPQYERSHRCCSSR